MSEAENSWAADRFDGIMVWTADGDLSIEGVDGDQISLDGGNGGRFPFPNRVQVMGPWLLLQMFPGTDDRGDHVLRVPKSKAWMLDVSTAQGDVSIRDIQARLQVNVHRGDTTVQDCRGVFTISTGAGDVTLDRCVDAVMPEPPPRPQPPDFPVPPAPEMPVPPGSTAPWQSWNANDWATWGMDVANQARNWAQQFRYAFGAVSRMPHKDGISIRTGHGDVHMQQIETASCAVHTGSGDTTIEGGWIGNLQVKAGRGDIECGSAMPANYWLIETAHGDLNVSLPANAQARLDVATRHGNIKSDVPLVRVGRPGPEARYGGRMVGTLGQTGEQTVEIALVAMHGDIRVRLDSTPSAFAGKQTTQDGATQRAAEPTADAATPPAGAVQQQPAHNPDEAENSTEMAVLQSLSEGKITAAEAEQLLRNLGV